MELKEKFKTLVIRLVMLSVYMTSGAAIFSVIEQDRDDGSKFTQELNEVKKNMSRQFNASMEVVNTLIQTLEQLLQENRRNCKFQHNDWNYYQSLYFVGSVTTTIGYGHLAPKTQAGRLFLIFFAIFGIPLNLLTLQSVGEHINIVVYLMIRYFEKAFLKREVPSNEHVKCFAISASLMILMLPLGGVMYYYSERENGWTFLDSVYYCFTALSTIGFGDLVPNEGKAPNQPYEKAIWFFRLLYLGLGLSLVSSVFTSICSAAKEIRALLPCKKGDYIVGRPSSMSETISTSVLNTCCRISEHDDDAILRSGSFCSTTDEMETHYSQMDDSTYVLSMDNISLSRNSEEPNIGSAIANGTHSLVGKVTGVDKNTTIPMHYLKSKTEPVIINEWRCNAANNDNRSSRTDKCTKSHQSDSVVSASNDRRDSEDLKEERVGRNVSDVKDQKQHLKPMVPQILVNGLNMEES